MARRPQPKRGVLLLIVLSLLVLFLLVGMSFIVSATGFREMANLSAKTDTTAIDGAQIANSTINQILHGNKSPLSRVRGHSLLEDLYGREFFVGRVVANPGTGNGVSSNSQQQVQLLDFQFVRWGSVPPAQLRDDYYGGCVLTFISGPAAGESTRILKYENRGSLRRIQFTGVLQANQAGNAFAGIQGGDLFVVNGRPFNGTGAGYSNSSTTPIGYVGGVNNALAIGSTQVPVALLPNYTAYRAQKTFREIALGGLDESYDAVDFQNMALAKVPSQVNVIADSDSNSVFLNNTGGIIPSFHRPYLLAYMAKNYPEVLKDPRSARALLFRPSRADHPSFTGSNPTFNRDILTWDGQAGEDGLPDGLFVGPWDVDNDGDGVADSIWMDFGHDPITGADGRMYKPLVAALVLDMDGRVNINTAGSLQQHAARTAGDALVGVHAAGLVANATVDSKLTTNLMGAGFGPADVNPHKLFGNGVTIYGEVLRRRYQGVAEEGASAVPGGISSSGVDEDQENLRDFRISHNVVPDRFISADQFSEQVMSGMQTSLFTGWGSVPDLSGRAIPFISPNGGLVYTTAGAQSLGNLDGIDDPYELAPLQHRWQDAPYTIEDLDFLLRLEDSRSQGRLHEVGAHITSSPFFSYRPNVPEGNTRRLFTTRSVHVPTIPSINPGKWRHDGVRSGNGGSINGEGLRRSVREMFAGKIRRKLQALNPGQNLAALEDQAFILAGQLLPPEIIRGEKLDINRALQGSILEKRQFATHLFNLMMLVSDDETVMPVEPASGISPQDQRELNVRRIAQWAINVVDFGDADAAMTYFEYDADPFNNSPVDGDPTGMPEPDARRIWGLEHPEMILTETLATHDRRVQDAIIGDPREENGSLQDDDLDQQQNPQATTFIELLCMRGMSQANGDLARNTPLVASEKGPEDLYDTGMFGPGQGRYWPRLNLARTDANGNPVWQLAISQRQTDTDVDPLELQETSPADVSFDPNDFSLLGSKNPQLEIARRVWFHRPTAGTPANDVFYNQGTVNRDYAYQTQKTELSNSPLPVVEPGMYVVIGSESISNIGLRKSGQASGQNVILVDQSNRNNNLYHQDVSGNRIRSSAPSRALSIVASNLSAEGRRTGLNISAPLNGYTTGATDRPKDSPLDPTDPESAPLWYIDPQVDDEENMQLMTGVREGFRTVFLQRLADPSRLFNSDSSSPNYNPYISIDWMPIDLSVFNSLDEEPNGWDENLGEFDPQDPVRLPDEAAIPEGLVPFELDGDSRPNRGYFASRERSGFRFGGNDENPIVGNELNIWAARSELGRALGMPGPEGNGYVQSMVHLRHTLGWLNRSFDIFPQNVPLHARDAEGHYVQPGMPYSETPNSYAAPKRTFPTLVWNNRPYANVYELMLVPACSASRLTHEFTASRTAQDPATGQQDAQVAQPVNLPMNRRQGLRQVRNVYKGAFGHLLNFFNSTAGTSQESAPSQDMAANNHFRIFDFVTVPSRFAGTKTWFNADTVNSTPGLPRWVSNLREPGRVNLNTAFESTVWQSLLGYSSADQWEFENAMAGANPDSPLYTDGTAGTNLRTPDGTYPAEYPFPFRAGVSADLVPPMVDSGSALPSRLAVDGTLLRTSPNSNHTPGIGPAEPALAKFRSPSEGGQRGDGNQVPGFGTPFQNRKSNAFFRYRNVIKLGASATSQSNVYAVWLTVGYFEIEPNYRLTGTDSNGNPQYDYTRPFWVDEAHPDGYRFGAEMGSEMGNVQRHRSFYIIDRSIPVAFEPGVNHNTDKAILLRRHLE